MEALMRSLSPVRFLVAVGLVLPVSLTAHVSPAAACGNSVRRQVDPRVMRLSQAEQVLGAGKFKTAAVSALQIYPKLRNADDPDALMARAQRIVAMATVRTEGFLTVGESFHASTSDERRANLEWAVVVLRRMTARSSTPSLETDLGEALSKLPEGKEEALALLGKLAKKDLITSPRGYAELAQLRHTEGDAEGRDAALARYEAMTRTRFQVVGAPRTKEGPGST
jgi:hypothetical protein